MRHIGTVKKRNTIQRGTCLFLNKERHARNTL
ncbi:hypothetical protein T01_12839 [Trichinella spiralis]|uniref:Uncharacterized protein n=1 Tax=Trichinella spiralis TaxID=6334 RepID=A0A0V0ZJM7_TRISP|nr:hypothetical protein T01_12839 [Trichinella spiralis]